ncbi:MAG: RHS repeat-associated core domain-containing protein [Capnocytophaga sp.]|nr:RHS repeat-associated core domain-containing protein [Capnocytophaga sp.]
MALDSEGNHVWNRQLDIYGRVKREFKSPLLGDDVRPFISFLYQGQYYDFETKLTYNRFRYYSSESGTYISQDPIRLLGSNPNLYAYVANNNWWVDVFGLDNFYSISTFTAPSGNTHTVYQQNNIDWDLKVNTSNGIKTNLELAQEGSAPFVIKNGEYSVVSLHHHKQDGKGTLIELSAATHQKFYGLKYLHPYLPKKHPINKVSHDNKWDADREAYWKKRAEDELNYRKTKSDCNSTK